LESGVKEMGQLSSNTVRGYVELGSAGQKKDLLGAKTRELIALAVAVTARCDALDTTKAARAPSCAAGDRAPTNSGEAAKSFSKSVIWKLTDPIRSTP
jgi:alkylhydroperoxidase/carboxymuconolactone decarboxylase family protein YurZ